MYLELIRMRLEHQYYRTLDVRGPKPTLRASSFLEHMPTMPPLRDTQL